MTLSFIFSLVYYMLFLIFFLVLSRFFIFFSVSLTCLFFNFLCCFIVLYWLSISVYSLLYCKSWFLISTCALSNCINAFCKLPDSTVFTALISGEAAVVTLLTGETFVTA